MGLLLVFAQMLLKNRNKGCRNGADDKELKNSIGQNEGGKIDIEIPFKATEETPGQEVVPDQAEHGRSQIRGADHEGGGKNTFVFGLEKFFAAINK